MERIEYPPCLYRGEDGAYRECPWPTGEPDRDEMPTDLYAPWYSVDGGILRPARVKAAEVTIFNTPRYRPDMDLEREAKDRLVRAIVAKEGAQVVQASGGVEAIRSMIGVENLWLDRKKR